MLRAASIGVACVLATGCGKKEESAAPPREQASGETGGAAKTTETEKPAAARKPAKELFTGKQPTLPAPVSRVDFGMTEEEAKAAAPEVMAEKYGWESPDHDGTKFHVQIEGGRVYTVRVEIDQRLAEVNGWLAQAWGEPREAKNAIGDAEYYWNDPESGIRAKLEGLGKGDHCQVIFFDVWSAEQLLGSEPGHFGFEKIPLIGATPEQVIEAFATWRPTPSTQDATKIDISLPPLDVSEYPSSLSLKLKDGKVTGYTAGISYSWDEKTKDILLAGLEAKLGKPKPDRMYLDYKGPPRAKVDASRPDSMTVWVGDYK